MMRSKASSVTLFLNRLLGLALSDQALLLHLFNYLLARAVRKAHREGSLDGGVEALPMPMLLASGTMLPETFAAACVGGSVACNAAPAIYSPADAWTGPNDATFPHA